MPQTDFRRNSFQKKTEPSIARIDHPNTKSTGSDKYGKQNKTASDWAHPSLSTPNYSGSKIFIIIFCSIFMVIGGPVFLFGIFGLVQGLANARFDFFSLFFSVWGAIFFFVGLYIMSSRLKQLSTFEHMTYTWYRSQYPDNVRGGKVSCFICGNPRIHARALMNHTYHREHFCTQCGKTLYYSPEQS